MSISVAFFDLGDTLVHPPNVWIPNAASVLASLQAQHIRLGIISNTGNLTRDELLDQLPGDFDLSVFDDDCVLLSSEVGYMKPDPAIFSLAIVRAGVPPRDCLFCTESLRDSLVASLCGMVVARVQKPPASDVTDLPAMLSASLALFD